MWIEITFADTLPVGCMREWTSHKVALARILPSIIRCYRIPAFHGSPRFAASFGDLEGLRTVTPRRRMRGRRSRWSSTTATLSQNERTG